MGYLYSTLLGKKRFRQLIVFVLGLVVISTIIIVPIESYSPNPRIKSYFDGLYWSIATITTVGYGDMTAVTVPGKIISMILEVTGAASFLTIFVIIGATMTQSADIFHFRRTQTKLEEIEKQLDLLRKQLQAQQNYPPKEN